MASSDGDQGTKSSQRDDIDGTIGIGCARLEQGSPWLTVAVWDLSTVFVACCGIDPPSTSGVVRADGVHAQTPCRVSVDYMIIGDETEE